MIARGRVARSAIFTSVILGARVVTQAFALLLVVRLFDPAIFGLLAAAGTLAVLLGVLPTLGSGFILMARAAMSASAIADVWRYAWPMTVVLGCCLTLAYIPLAMLATGRHALPFVVLAVLGVSELLATPLIVLASFALQASDRVPLSQVIQSLPFVLRAFAILPCFLLSPTNRLEAYVFLQFVATAMALVVAMSTIRRVLHLHGAPRPPSKTEIADGATYAGMQAISANATEIDKVLAVRLMGSHDSGLYAAASRVLVSLMMPVHALLLAASPRLFSHGHAPTLEGLQLVRKVAQLSAAWGLVSALLLITGSIFVPILFGSAYEASSRLMFWMAFVAPFMAMRFAAGSVLVAIGRPFDRLIFELTGLFVIIGGLLTLAPVFGPRGLVLAVGLGECVMLGLGITLVLRRLDLGIARADLNER